jgi:hypothetical protein
MRSEEE